MLNRSMLDYLLLVSVLMIVTCSGDTTVDVNSEEFDRFTTVYAELAIGFELAGYDSTKYKPIRDSILDDLKIDTAWISSYTSSLDDDPEKWMVVWTEITRKLEVKKDSLTP